MAEITAIEWATSTWNPWMACHKISPGCRACYMFRDMKRYGRDPNVVVRSTESTFRNPLKWARNGKVAPGSKIFTCSWSDWFIEEADPWREEAWQIIKATPQFKYLILTKRIERAADHLPKDWGHGYDNVWLGVSVETQEYFRRVKALCNILAKVRFLSLEPMLGEINLHFNDPCNGHHRDETTRHIDCDDYKNNIHWVITGGESDRTSPRPCDLDWIRSIRDQCVKAGIPFFHKQHGGSRKIDGAWGGRILDDRIWNQFPVNP